MRFYKKALLWGVVCSLTLQIGFQASAESNNDNCLDSRDYTLFPAAVELIVKDTDMGEVLKKHDLLNSENELVAYCLDFEHGYVIYDEFDNIIEYSPTAESPYKSLDDSTYYAGPLQYFEKEQEDFVDIRSNRKISDADFEIISQRFAEQSQQELQVTETNDVYGISLLATGTYYDNVLSHAPRRLNYNTEGTCGSLAAAILLCYYHDYIDSKYLKQEYSNNPKELHQDLINHIEIHGEMGALKGSNMSSLRSGLHFAIPLVSHFKTKEIDVLTDTSSYLSIWNHAYYLTNNVKIPYILSIQNHPQYKYHWVVGYGTSQFRNGTSVLNRFYIVNDGWGKNDIRIAYGFCNGMVYLD